MKRVSNWVDLSNFNLLNKIARLGPRALDTVNRAYTGKSV